MPVFDVASAEGKWEGSFAVQDFLDTCSIHAFLQKRQCSLPYAMHSSLCCMPVGTPVMMLVIFIVIFETEGFLCPSIR